MEEYTGRIIRGIGGFYYVDTGDDGIFTCRAKGLFRNEGVKPLVGDVVKLIPVVDTDVDNPGSITAVLERTSELVRPAIANIDRAIVIFAAADPEPNLMLLDRFLCEMERRRVESIVCFNKSDLADRERLSQLSDIYEKAGYRVVLTSAKNGDIDALKKELEGRVCAVAGPSGAGKSSIVNLLQSDMEMETGLISKKLGRGRHTTRRAELLKVEGMKDTYIADTPGFSSLEVAVEDPSMVYTLFPEIRAQEKNCRFSLCSHIKEKDCAVRSAVKDGIISKERYDSYCSLYRECVSRKKY